MIKLDMHWELCKGPDGRKSLRMLWHSASESAVTPLRLKKNRIIDRNEL